MKTFTPPSIATVSIAGIALLAGAVALYYAKSGAPPEEEAAAPRAALTVTAAPPEQTRLPIRLSANGNIVAWQEAIIGSESNGLRLTEVHVNVGDVVKAGQVLARFSGSSVLADVAQARASLVEAQATAADAAANAARARTLQDSGALSTQQINQYNTSEQTARARVAAAQAVLDAQQVRGNNTQVLAPDSGIISARNATVGAVVGAGTELFRMIRGGRLEWRAEVTSTELGRIPPGTPVTVVAASGAQLQGRVRMVAPTVDPQTRSALVYVDLPPTLGKSAPAGRRAGPAPANPAASAGSEARETPNTGTALAGMFARGEFELGASDALTVPQQAIVVRDGFNYVFRLNPDNRVSQTKVQTGRLAGDRVEVTGGLTADLRVVVSGAGFLNDGDLVRLAPTPAPGQAPAPAAPASAATR
jgi:RND family efflux transporter MFP subunit